MTRQDIATAPIAGVAITYPWIHNWIEFAASEAKLLLPILGAIWLVVQIVAKVKNTWFKSDE